LVTHLTDLNPPDLNQMSPHNLTPAEIAKLMAPENHPTPLTADELEQLVSPLTDEQFGEVVDHLGLSDLARQLPPVLLKVMRVVQRLTRDRLPEYDDEIDTLIRNFEFMDLPGTFQILFFEVDTSLISFN
jgi:hypothetical protein